MKTPECIEIIPLFLLLPAKSRFRSADLRHRSRGRDPSRALEFVTNTPIRRHAQTPIRPLRRLLFRAVFKPRVFLAERQRDLSGRTVSLFCDDEFRFSGTSLLFLFIGRVVFRPYQ